MKEIYISFFQTWHDLSMCMLYRGKIYAIELERLCRVKHCDFKLLDKSLFISDLIKKGVDYLLSCINYDKNSRIKGIFFVDDEEFLDKDFLDSIFYKYYIFLTNQRDTKKLLNMCNLEIPEEHHFFHWISSYFSSWFSESAILVMDANGYEGEWSALDITFVQSIYYGKGKNVKLLHWTKYSEKQGLYGIWTIYELISEYIIGMEASKVMWLSAYGNKDKFKHIKLFDFNWLDVSFFRRWLSFDSLKQYVFKLYWIKKEDYDYRDITKSIFADIAAHLQYETEKAISYLWKKIKEITDTDNLCVSGGVWLNVIANRLLVKDSWFKKVFIPPFVGDQWISLWLLYYFYYYIEDQNLKKYDVNNFLSLGKTYKNINKTLNNFDDKIVVEKLDIKKVANELYTNKVIAIFNKWSEFWPRALWFRSILASPLLKENNIKVNNIKNRELWRPLAPIILENEIKNYLEDVYLSPYMFLSSYVLSNKRNLLKWVIHVDNSVRYQTINKNNDLVYKILKEFYKISWVPVLMNTSLNVKGEPIVETPEDAIKLFLSTDLDYLIMDNYLISKSKKYTEFKFDFNNVLFNIIPNEALKKKYLKYRDILWKILFEWKYESKFIFRGLNVYSYKIKDLIVNIIYENNNIYLQLEWDKKVSDSTNYFDFMNRFNYLLDNHKNLLVHLFKI